MLSARLTVRKRFTTRELLLNSRHSQSVVGKRSTNTVLLGNLLACVARLPALHKDVWRSKSVP